MNKWILLLIFLGCSWITQAHQADLSTTMLVEQADNKWVLQVRASLTAFQHEIKTNYSENAYATPKEFEELVINHMKKNLSIDFNQGSSVVFQNAYVKLGHETNVVFEVVGVPENINSVVVKNSSFKDIHRNQSALVILKKGFSKEQFILNNANQHTAILRVEASKFVSVSESMAMISPSFFYLKLGTLILILGGIVYLYKNPKKNIEMDIG